MMKKSKIKLGASVKEKEEKRGVFWWVLGVIFAFIALFWKQLFASSSAKTTASNDGEITPQPSASIPSVVVDPIPENMEFSNEFSGEFA